MEKTFTTKPNNLRRQLKPQDINYIKNNNNKNNKKKISLSSPLMYTHKGKTKIGVIF